MVAHSTPKTGVEWGTQSPGCWEEKNISRKGRQHRDLSTALRFGRDDKFVGTRRIAISTGGVMGLRPTQGDEDRLLSEATLPWKRRPHLCHLDRSVAEWRDLCVDSPSWRCFSTERSGVERSAVSLPGPGGRRSIAGWRVAGLLDERLGSWSLHWWPAIGVRLQGSARWDGRQWLPS
jgi:hypothetical protein